MQIGMEEYFSSHVCDKVCIELGLDKTSPVHEVLSKLRAQICKNLKHLGKGFVAPESMSVKELLDELTEKQVVVTSGSDKADLVEQLHKARGTKPMTEAEAAQNFVDVVDNAVKSTEQEAKDEDEEGKRDVDWGRASTSAPKGVNPFDGATTSPRKPPAKKFRARPVCRFFSGQGFCNKGNACRFKHVK